MEREILREFARNRWPVVQTETGSHGEIGYPYIREIKAVYASPAEVRAGYPRERLSVVLADRSGHSFTEVQARGIRLPTRDEAVLYALPGTELNELQAELDRLREMEERT